MAESQKTDENSSTKEEYTETVNVSAVCDTYYFSIFLSKNILNFQGSFIGGFVQELFGSYDCPPFTIVNTFEVDGKTV